MDFPLNPDFPYYIAEADLLEMGDRFPRNDGVDWGRLLFFAEETGVSPGQHLIRQFDCDGTIYVLTHGELEVRIASKRGGEEQSIAKIEPIAVIGEQSFIDDGPRTASVVALRHSTAYRLNRKALEEMREREPDIAWAFMMDIARSLSHRARGLLQKQAGL